MARDWPLQNVLTRLSAQALVATNTPGLGYMDLLRMLTGPVYSQSAALPHKQAYCSIAKCVAALTRACPAEGPAVVGQFIQVSRTCPSSRTRKAQPSRDSHRS